MQKTITRSLLAGVLLTATSCAGSYTALRPDRVPYQMAVATTGPVEFTYQYDALIQHGHRNKKYVKKETKYGYQIVDVRITNHTSQELNFSRDLTLFYGDRPISPVPAMQAAHDLRQGVLIYLLYIPANVTIGGTIDPITGQTRGGSFLPTGPIIAAGNIVGASSANSNLRREFEQYDLTNRVIKPGETVYGIVSLRETNVAPLRLEMRAPIATQTVPPASALPTPIPAAPSLNSEGN